MKNVAAQQAFDAKLAEIATLLEDVQDAVNMLSSDEDNGGIHWGHVGSANHIVAMLKRAAGKDEE